MEHVLAVAFGNELLVRVPTIGIFLCVAQAVEHVLAVAFRNELLVRVPLSAYFFVWPRWLNAC